MKKKICLAVALASALMSVAEPSVDVSFKPGQWNTNDWILVKSPRFDYIHGFVQKSDGIENECPDISGEEIYRKHCNRVYSAMVWKEKAALGQTVSSTMNFDWRMAPLIVLSAELRQTDAGAMVFGEHWEIVLYDQGINVWHHMIRDGKPYWYKAAYIKTPYAKNEKYTLEVRVARNSKGVKEMVVKCGGQEFAYVDHDLPETFYAGIIGCEGRNRFFDFRISGGKSK